MVSAASCGSEPQHVMVRYNEYLKQRLSYPAFNMACHLLFPALQQMGISSSSCHQLFSVHLCHQPLGDVTLSG